MDTPRGLSRTCPGVSPACSMSPESDTNTVISRSFLGGSVLHIALPMALSETQVVYFLSAHMDECITYVTVYVINVQTESATDAKQHTEFS